ncbi:MAG: hypothetical protein A2X11_13765 [Bacteroidetes bacterium GWE2_42_24]|nr:MAG: hypothetical protein A2X11_13765 [Bacteroidetes bacterium GWE2_42_24]OFY30114.1 MAG: hypothetical protein A2X09_14010 [Bacteroidetes bacterium GWF2_43_11]
MKNNFIQRTLTGALLVALIVSLILFNNILFTALMCAVALGCAHELHSLINLTNAHLKTTSFITVTVAFLLLSGLGVQVGSSLTIAVTLGFILLIPMVSSLFIRDSNALEQSFLTIVPVVYVAIPLGILPRFIDVIPGRPDQPVMILSLFVLIWVNDTFAYLTGISIGRHRLFERVSPKKSWEGAIGGLLFSLGAAFGLFEITGLMILPIWLGLAIVVVIFGIFGDLLESLLKRSKGVKDSGDLLPGHGGLLDRFDAVLLSVPAAWIYLSIVLI